MAHASLLEQPVVVHTRPAIDMDDEQFFQFCQINRDLQIERTAEGDNPYYGTRSRKQRTRRQ